MEATKILVVDDDPQLRAVMAKKLSELGYDVDTAPDGVAALEKVRGQPFELAVLDYQMPGLNGIEFFQAARRISPHLLGVFVTAHARLETVYSAVDAGMSRVLAKPVDFTELGQIIETCLGQAREGDLNAST
ncbi:MAG: response regulator [Pirellulales bacterium]|nr:response regulator [Pirellulales bacterium]